MSDQLILVLNCGSSSLKGAVIDRKSGSVVLSCLGERLTTPEAVITFNKDGNKRQVPLTGRNCHAGAVGMLLNELENTACTTASKPSATASPTAAKNITSPSSSTKTSSTS